MTTEELQAIRSIMKETLDPFNQRLDRIEDEISNIKYGIADVKVDISNVQCDIAGMKNDISGIHVVLDAEIKRDVKLIAEGHEILLECIPDASQAEDFSDKLDVLDAVVKEHSRFILKLKHA